MGSINSTSSSVADLGDGTVRSETDGNRDAVRRWQRVRIASQIFRTTAGATQAQIRGHAAFVPRMILRNIASGEGVGAIPIDALTSEDVRTPGGAVR